MSGRSQQPVSYPASCERSDEARRGETDTGPERRRPLGELADADQELGQADRHPAEGTRVGGVTQYGQHIETVPGQRAIGHTICIGADATLEAWRVAGLRAA